MKKIISSVGCLIEGPVWNKKRNSLFFTDILAGTLFEYSYDLDKISSWKVGKYLGAIFLGSNRDEIFLAVDNSIKKLNLVTGNAEILFNIDLKDEVRFNDGKCDTNGNIIVGTMATNQGVRGCENLGNLYHISPNGKVNIIEDNMSIPNGMSWSLDKKYFYHIETLSKAVFVYDYDEKTSIVKNRKKVIDLKDEIGVPDGMTMDKDGNLWIAMYGGYKVIQVNPTTGKKLNEVSVQDKNVTSCTFGGKQLDILFITTTENVYICDVGTSGMLPYLFCEK